jgi:type I restriction enzyme M protein
MPNNHNTIEKRLWDSADELRANSKLKASEYSVPVLGLIFLRYADHKFGLAEKELARPARPTTRPAASCTCPRRPGFHGC